MGKIQNWSRTKTDTVTDAKERGVLSATMVEWEHDETGQTVEIRWVNGETRERYDLDMDGEVDVAYSTLKRAKKETVKTLRAHPEGL